MAVNTTVKNKEKKLTFPCLMIVPSTGKIVLMSEAGRGTVIKGDEHQNIGHYANTWLMSAFEVFQDSITLENK